VDELNGENVDIVRWSEDPQELIRNSLKPAEVEEVNLDKTQKRATVYVTKDHLSQAIGKGGRNVRLASRLAGWEIDIYELGGDTPERVPDEDEPSEEVPPPAEGQESKNEG